MGRPPWRSDRDQSALIALPCSHAECNQADPEKKMGRRCGVGVPFLSPAEVRGCGRLQQQRPWAQFQIVWMSDRCRVPIDGIPDSWWGRSATQIAPWKGMEPDRLTLPHTNISTRCNHEQAADAQTRWLSSVRRAVGQTKRPATLVANPNSCGAGRSRLRHLFPARALTQSVPGAPAPTPRH
jgi:hypothetical protein